MAKTDMENGYRLVPINERDHDLLGFTMEEKFFYDKVLPIGLSYSCNLFEKFSTAVHWVVEHKIRSSGCVHVLDDFLFVGPPKSVVSKNPGSIFTYGTRHWHPYQRGKDSISHYKDYIFRLRA